MGRPPCRRLEVGKSTSYVLNQAWSRVRCSVCNVVGGPSKLCIWDLNTSYTIVPIHIFGPHAVYTGSSDRPRLPCAVFCDDTDICGLPECIYIIPLTDNEGYVLAMNGFLLVRVRADHRQMSLKPMLELMRCQDSLPHARIAGFDLHQTLRTYLVLNYLAFMVVVCIER